MERSSIQIALLLLAVTGCKEGKTEKSASVSATATPNAPSPTTPVLAPVQEPAGSVDSELPTESKCDLSSTYIYATVPIQTTALAVGAGSKVPESAREYVKVSCTQCVGEDFSYGVCPKEYGWDCWGVAMGLDELDAGRVLRGKDLRRLYVEPVDSAKELQEQIGRLLEHLDDPERFTYLDRGKAKALATTIEAAAAKLSGAPTGKKWEQSGLDRALLKIGFGNTYIAIQDNEVSYLAADGLLKYGKTACPSGNARD